MFHIVRIWRCWSCHQVLVLSRISIMVRTDLLYNAYADNNGVSRSLNISLGKAYSSFGWVRRITGYSGLSSCIYRAQFRRAVLLLFCITWCMHYMICVELNSIYQKLSARAINWYQSGAQSRSGCGASRKRWFSQSGCRCRAPICVGDLLAFHGMFSEHAMIIVTPI